MILADLKFDLNFCLYTGAENIFANLKFDLRFTKLEKLKARKKHFVFFYTAVNSYAEPLGTGRLSLFFGIEDHQDHPGPRMSLSQGCCWYVCWQLLL